MFPECLKCGWGPAPLILSITVSIFPQLPWLGPKFMKTQNESQQNKNKDLFEVLFLKDIDHAQNMEVSVDKFGHSVPREERGQKQNLKIK